MADLRTILLVEDEPSDAALIRRGFEKAKVLNPVVHLSDGDKAFLYLQGEGEYTDRIRYPLPAMILLDLKIPGMSGLRLLQWMRTRRDIKRIPVVVLTADDRPSTINSAYDLGANSYLVKPGDRDEVARVVKDIERYWMELNQPPQLAMKAES